MCPSQKFLVHDFCQMLCLFSSDEQIWRILKMCKGGGRYYLMYVVTVQILNLQPKKWMLASIFHHVLHPQPKKPQRRWTEKILRVRHSRRKFHACFSEIKNRARNTSEFQNIPRKHILRQFHDVCKRYLKWSQSFPDNHALWNTAHFKGETTKIL